MGGIESCAGALAFGGALLLVAWLYLVLPAFIRSGQISQVEREQGKDA